MLAGSAAPLPGAPLTGRPDMRVSSVGLSALVLATALGVDATPPGAAPEEFVVGPTQDCQSGGFSAEDGSRSPLWTLTSLEAQLKAEMQAPVSTSGGPVPNGFGNCSAHQVCAWGCDFNNSCEDLGCHPALVARCLQDQSTGWSCCVVP